jgi:hypothetical protein
MTYVPIVTPPVTQPPPSPRTRELAGLLTKVLEEYSKAHPAVTAAEVRAALRIAQMSAGPDRSKMAAGVSVAVGLGVAALTMGLFFFRSAGSGEVEFPVVLPMVILGIIVVLGMVVAMIRLKGP